MQFFVLFMMEKSSSGGNSQIVAAAMITSFMTTFMSSALNLSVPSLESYFGVNAAYVSWIVSSYTIAVAAMSLPMGKVSDITSLCPVNRSSYVSPCTVGNMRGNDFRH